MTIKPTLLNTCLTKDEHDALVAERGRPVTQDPIQRHSVEPVDAPQHHTITDGDRLARLVERLA